MYADRWPCCKAFQQMVDQPPHFVAQNSASRPAVRRDAVVCCRSQRANLPDAANHFGVVPLASKAGDRCRSGPIVAERMRSSGGKPIIHRKCFMEQAAALRGRVLRNTGWLYGVRRELTRTSVNGCLSIQLSYDGTTDFEQSPLFQAIRWFCSQNACRPRP